MEDHAVVERLTSLDLSMPRTYIRVLLVFETEATTAEVKESLQRGLGKLSTQIPWLSGRVVSTTTSGANPSREIRSAAGDGLTPLDKGMIEASYKDLSSKGMPTGAIPLDIWPVPDVLTTPLADSGDAVFAASVFSFADAAIGLCVCLHHNATDATGCSEIIRLWAQTLTNSDLVPLSQCRSERLSNALSPALAETSSLSSDNLLEQHPEYSKTPPNLPTQFYASISKQFSIPLHWIDILKDLLRKHISSPITTNTILSALLWTSITRARTRRNLSLKDESSRLVTAVNGRRRIDETLSTPENPYLGNMVLYALTEHSAAELASSDEDSIHSLAQICNRISASQSPSKINAHHIAEVYHLNDNKEEPRNLFPGWDLFGSKDLVITSWADLEFYEMDFGEGLGKPRFVRLPLMEADGVVIVLPRRRGGDQEMIEVMVMLRVDDMQALEGDSMWQTLTSCDK